MSNPCRYLVSRCIQHQTPQDDTPSIACLSCKVIRAQVNSIQCHSKNDQPFRIGINRGLKMVGKSRSTLGPLQHHSQVGWQGHKDMARRKRWKARGETWAQCHFVSKICTIQLRTSDELQSSKVQWLSVWRILTISAHHLLNALFHGFWYGLLRFWGPVPGDKSAGRDCHTTLLRHLHRCDRLNGYYYKKKSYENGCFGGTPISGNLHSQMLCSTSLNSWSQAANQRMPLIAKVCANLMPPQKKKIRRPNCKLSTNCPGSQNIETKWTQEHGNSSCTSWNRCCTSLYVAALVRGLLEHPLDLWSDPQSEPGVVGILASPTAVRGFHSHGGTQKSWMVFIGKSHEKTGWWLGVPLWLRKPP